MEFGRAYGDFGRVDPFACRGYGFRDPHSPGILHRPGENGGSLLIHFHDPVWFGPEGEEVEIPAESLVFWPPGHSHRFGRSDRGWVHSWFWCESPRVREWAEEAGLPVAGPLAFPAPALTEKYLRWFHEELSLPPEPDPEILVSVVRCWFREIGREVRGEGVWLGTRHRLVELRSRIERRWREPLRLSELAAEASLSVSHFSALFRAEFGISPMAYHQRLRLQHAAHLLADANLSIGQVAEAVGYEDALHFSRQFRRAFGTSPRGYRGAQASGSMVNQPLTA